jgi:hypothetical protein
VPSKHTHYLDDPRIMMPPEKSVWKNDRGAVRHVVEVDEINVGYRRPAPAPFEMITVTGGAFAFWIETTNAKRIA